MNLSHFKENPLHLRYGALPQVPGHELFSILRPQFGRANELVVHCRCGWESSCTTESVGARGNDAIDDLVTDGAVHLRNARIDQAMVVPQDPPSTVELSSWGWFDPGVW